MGWIKPTVSMTIGALLGYFLGDLLGSYIQVYVWDFIGSFIKYLVIVVAVLLGIYLGWGLTKKNKDTRHDSILVLDIVVGATVGFYLGRLLGAYLGELASVYVWDFIGVIIQYFFLVLGTVIGIGMGVSIAMLFEDNTVLSAYGRKGDFITLHITGDTRWLNAYKDTDQIISITGNDDTLYEKRSLVNTSNLPDELLRISLETLNLTQELRELQFEYTIVDNATGEIIKMLVTWRELGSMFARYNDTRKKPSKHVKNTHIDNHKERNKDNDTKKLTFAEELLSVEELMIQTAFYMSNIDGNIDEKEGKLITSFGKKILEKKSSKEDYLKNKEQINGYIKNAQKDVKDNRINIHNVLLEIYKKCTLDEKKFLFETCLYIAAADGAIDKSELKFAKYLAKNMDLNKVESKIMIEKILPSNDGQKQKTKKIEKTLGITSNMSNETILEILKKEYKKWNQRVGLSDPKKREEAEKMLHNISELRKKYKN